MKKLTGFEIDETTATRLINLMTPNTLHSHTVYSVCVVVVFHTTSAHVNTCCARRLAR